MADVEIITKKINELTAQAEAGDDDLLAVGNNETGLLKKITVKNHAESIKNTIIGESEEIADIADGTVVGAIKQFDKDIPETQGIITEAFSETETYAVGDLCIYENKLYTFKETKNIGEWDSEVVEETTVKKLLDQKNDLVSDAFDPTKSYSAGDYCIYDNTLYKFLEDKDVGEWDGDAELVQAVNVMGELNSALTENATPIEVTSLISTITITNNNSYYHNGIVYISFSCSNTGNWATSSSAQTQTDFAQIDTKYVQANPTSVALAASLSANGLIVQGAYLLNASNDAKIRLLATGSSSASPQNLYISGSYYIGAV